MGFRHQPIRRTKSGIELSLSENEREMMGVLVTQLRELLGSDDASLRRLFPTAYQNDPQRDAEYQILARSELQDRKYAALDTVDETLHATLLDDEQAIAWMQVINQLRLVLGTRLDVGEDDDDFDPDGPDALSRSVYFLLGMFLDQFVAAM